MKIRPHILLQAVALGLLLCMFPAAALPTPAEAAAAVPSAFPSLMGEEDPAAALRPLWPQLEALGLDAGDISCLWARLGPALAQHLEGLEDPAALRFLTLPYAREALLGRYAAYAGEHPELSREDTVTRVNIGLDRPFYAEAETIADPTASDVLVNKYHALPADYEPELIPLGKLGSGSLTAPAAEAFGKMVQAAAEDGVALRSVSAYRSYATQASIYRRFRGQYSLSFTDSVSARPGHSEHQTGLALDINTATLKDHFETTPAFAWLEAHCAQYGFILRYPQGKEDITGYRAEPWHYRYVGVETAQLCTNQGLTFEEYLARQAAEDTDTPPVLTWHGQALTPERPGLVLSGTLWLPAAETARALGWTVSDEGGLLTLTSGGRTVTLRSGCLCTVNGGELRWLTPPLDLGGGLYLPLDSLCAALGLSCRQEEGQLALSPALSPGLSLPLQHVGAAAL